MSVQVRSPGSQGGKVTRMVSVAAHLEGNMLMRVCDSTSG